MENINKLVIIIIITFFLLTLPLLDQISPHKLLSATAARGRRRDGGEGECPFPCHQTTGFFPKEESVRKGTWSSGHRDRCPCPRRWLCRTNSTRLFHHRLPLAPVCSAQSSSRAPLRTAVPDETKHLMYCNHQSHTLFLTERELRRISLFITNNPSSRV